MLSLDLWVIKTLLANENQAFGLRIAFDRKPRLLTSIDGYARFRDVRVRPRPFRVPAQTRAGSGCTSATACCVQAETKPSQTAPPRSTVLDCAALSVAWLDRVTDTGEAGNGSILASRRLPAVVAMAVAVPPPRTTEDQRRDPPVDSSHEDGQPKLGSTSHSWRTTPAGVHDFRADRITISASPEASPR